MLSVSSPVSSALFLRFWLYVTKASNAVGEGSRSFVLAGTLSPHWTETLEYCAQQQSFSTLQIVSNQGTLL